MLRITVAETADQTAFERPLLFYWKKTHRTDKNRKCIVDLNDVTFVGTKGERLLRTMSKQGVQFIASGISIKHLLQERCER
jgi:anti-anti-sigma regulatory factor